MYALIVFIAAWTNPETGDIYAKGDVARIPSSYIAGEERFGLAGKYRWPSPWESLVAGDKGAPEKAPANPADAPAADAVPLAGPPQKPASTVKADDGN